MPWRAAAAAVVSGTVLLGTGFGGATPAHALTFNFTEARGAGTVAAQALAGFQAAAGHWSSLLTDNITVNITIDFLDIASGALGETGSVQALYSYGSVRGALIGDASSADDVLAASNLQSGPAVSMLLNYTSNNPNGVGSPTRYLDNDGDANNTNIRMTNANAKALGIYAGAAGANDARIEFNSRYGFDFDPTDGISSGLFDFVGVATHEIGHALGFLSGVDVLDFNSSNPYFRDDQFTFVSTMDLFRFSAASAATAGGVSDFTAGNSGAYFSLDRGATNLGLFATGVIHGDGNQASHWKDNLGLGIMDPTAAPGERLVISERDLRVFDVIGFNRVGVQAIPEPSTAALVGAAGSLLGASALSTRQIRRRRRGAR